MSEATRKSWYEVENRTRGDAPARLRIHDGIGAFGISSDEFVGELEDLREQGAPDINLNINSPGGSVDGGISIYNALRDYPGTVTVFVSGIAASIASVIALAGERRVMQPHSRMMIHTAALPVVGFLNAESIKQLYDVDRPRLDELSNTIASVYAERAGKTVAYWRALMDAETWFTDANAVSEGLAHEVGRERDMAALKAVAQFDLSNYRHAPEFVLIEPEVSGPTPADPRAAARRELETALARVGVRS